MLVDGIDFSDDKMLQGRTLSYSDTQRYRVGPNYLQLPINAPTVPASTNQRDGQMAYHVDGAGENPHVNYEPSSLGGLHEAPQSGADYEPEISGRLTRSTIARTNDYAQAGERYRTMPEWEREDLVTNLVDLLLEPIRELARDLLAVVRGDADQGRDLLPVEDADPHQRRV